MNKYSDKLEDFKLLFNLELNNKIKKSKKIKDIIEDYEIDITTDPEQGFYWLMLHALNEILDILKVKCYGSERSGSRNDSDGEFLHLFLANKNGKFYEVMFNLDDEDESTEFYAMHEVERYETKVFKFKRL
jgi:hypothetical protein